MTRRFLFAALIGALGTACALGPAEPPPLQGSRKVLFVGNSLTYTNGLPAMMEAVARQAGDTTLGVAMVAYPDFALSDHYQQNTTREWLPKRKLSFVVLQQGSSALPESQVNLREWTQQYAPRIRESGAEPVLFMVWPTTARLFDFPNVATSYRNAAAAVNGIFAPAGAAWVEYARASSNSDTPGASAFAPLYVDGLHPTVPGTYLAAIVLLERITGASPTSLPPVIPGYPAQESLVRALQQAAARALADNAARPAAVR